ncbi:MAG: hypothetical protein BAJALOKI1v1_900001 [Promethearchaeota archaeon]|nr:MAG: hypothetical protein BAJALOKI1v1_900001 [Candidatus Lokiarchaeota archaeon]
MGKEEFKIQHVLIILTTPFLISKMFELRFCCFCSDISDFYNAKEDIFWNYNCVIKQYFILKESIQCKNKIIKPEEGKTLFSFMYKISDYFPKKRSIEEVEDFANKIQNLEYFNDKARRNYICNLEYIRNELDKNWKLKNARYFFNEAELLKYCYKHGLISLEKIPSHIKQNIKELLKITNREIKDEKELARKYFGYNWDKK